VTPACATVMSMERRRRHHLPPAPLEAMANLVRLGAGAPAVSGVGVLDVAATGGEPSTAVSEMLAVQRSGDTARGE
jgi:hypothetical protein